MILTWVSWTRLFYRLSIINQILCRAFFILGVAFISNATPSLSLASYLCYCRLNLHIWRIFTFFHFHWVERSVWSLSFFDFFLSFDCVRAHSHISHMNPVTYGHGNKCAPLFFFSFVDIVFVTMSCVRIICGKSFYFDFIQIHHIKWRWQEHR